MKKWFILLALVLLMGCGSVGKEDYTIKLSKEDCDEYTGWGLSCGSNYKESIIKLSTYIKTVVDKELFDERDHSDGEFYYYEKDWGKWVWKTFKRKDIVDGVDGYSKFKVDAYYGEDIWVPDSCLFYYNDYRPKRPSPFKKIKKEIANRAKEEYKKMEEK